MFVPEFGTSLDAQAVHSMFKDSTLIIPCTSVGLSPYIAMDLFALNDGAKRVGFYDSEYINPTCPNDVLRLQGQAPGQISMPAEIWQSPDNKLTFLGIKSSVSEMRPFCDEVIAFTKEYQFKEVMVLTSTVSPVRRGRESNRQIPELYAYLNNFAFKGDQEFYEREGFKKFGHWIQDKKSYTHQELNELAGAGWGKRLLKSFNRHDIKCTLYVMFCTGGFDFVGGFTFYNFVKKTKAEDLKAKGITDGDQVHELLFSSGQMKIPENWKLVLAYF